jgi:serine protease DegQ
MRRWLLASCLPLLFFAPLCAQEIGPKPREVLTSYEIPYKLTDTKHVMVRVKLNGKGPFNFILDTGAPALIMSETVAKKCNAKLDSKNWGDFKLDIEGGLTILDAKGLSTDMFQLKGMNAMGVAGVELHGVLGYNILAQFRIQYDFTQDKLVWTKLDFTPPKMSSIGKKSDGQGSLEFVGDLMKFIAPVLGLRPNFDLKPRGYLGVILEEKTDALYIQSILPESPAEKAGLKVGDRIRVAKGKQVDTVEEMMKAINKLGEGEKLKLTIKRGEDNQDITVELGKGL